MQEEPAPIKVLMELKAPKEVVERELFQLLQDLRKLAESRGFEVLL